MYSELVCVGADGKLYQWRWEDPLPYQEQDSGVYHPRVRALGLADEKVVSVSASSIRASVLTESGKVRQCYNKIMIIIHNNNLALVCENYELFQKVTIRAVSP